MPKSFTHMTFFFFFLTALSGVWMRLYPLNLKISFPYPNVLHSHSHLAILGWTFLSIFIIFLTLFWHQMKEKAKAEAKLLITILFIVTFIMFITFLYQSYGLYSIIMSTLHIFLEYWVISFIYRLMKRIQTIPRTSVLFIKASLFSLIISSIGPFSLGFISASGLKESYLFDVAIYFYLHFQYNGWLFLFLVGLFIIILGKRNISIRQPFLLTGFWLYIIALFPSFFASVLWVDHGYLVYLLAIIGNIGQWIATICILISFSGVIKSLQRQVSKRVTALLGLTFLMLFFKSTMELGLVIPNLASLVFETRSVIIGYLHFTLLGFVSIFILTQYIMTHIVGENKYTSTGFTIFLIGFFLNELLLFTQGLFTWLNLGSLPLYSEGLLLASLLLLMGILTLWVSFSEHSTTSYKR